MKISGAIAIEKNNAIRQYFVIFYVIICILWMFPLLGSFRSWLSWSFSILGIALIIWDIISSRLIFKTSYWFFGVVFISVYGFSALFNGDITSGIKQLIHSGIFFFVLFTQNRENTDQVQLRQVQRINHTIMTFAFLAGLISLAMFFFNIGFIHQNGMMVYRTGFMENRLYGVYTSPNVGALFAIISVIGGSINSVIRTGKIYKWKKIYILNAVIQLVYFALALSNGANLSIAVLLFMLIALIIFPKLKEKYRLLTSLALSFLCFVVFGWGLSAITTEMKNVLPIIANATNKMLSKVIPDVNAPAEEIELERIESGEDMSNNRFTIWSGAIKLWRNQPLFGLGHADYNESPEIMEEKIQNAQLTEQEASWMRRVKGSMHNTYIQILVYSGLLGLIIFLTFMFLILKKNLKHLISNKQDSKHYMLIALFLCTVIMLLANGLVESHLLFNRQNPIAAIFWIYLGMGLFLINKSQEEYRSRLGHYAFVCETPYQAFNEMNFLLNDVDHQIKNADIYIYHQFPSATAISKKIKSKNIFQSVIDIKPYETRRTAVNKLRTLTRILFSLNALKRHEINNTHFYRNAYSHLVCCSYTLFTINLFVAFKPEKVYFLEDGTGSYYGNIEKDYRSGLFSFFNRFFMNGALDYHPKRLYVNNPALCRSTMTDDIRQLPPLNNQNPALPVLNEIFGYQDDRTYTEKKAVYLTQPLDEVAGYISGMHETLTELLKPYKQALLVRVHPRQLNANSADLDVDDVNNLWELECIHHITDSHVLIGAFSTAQLAPKLLCDKEPYLVFTYKLFFSNTDSAFWCGTAGLIEQFNSLYRQSGRICVPESMEELEAVLDRLLADRDNGKPACHL